MSSPPLIPTVDRISALPDPLICHILSFLPTKLAVTTSVLSKRWIPLWRSVLTLDFDDESFTDFAMFRHSVYSVIVSRDITLPIRSFRIKCRTFSENFDPFDVNRFVDAAAQRQIENFDLELVRPHLCYPFHKEKELTTGIFRVLSCRTLVALKLNCFAVYDVPQLVHLPLLKTLDLKMIKFIGGVAHFGNLVRGCPILEDFLTNYVEVWFPDGRDHEMNRNFEGYPHLLRADFNINCYVPPLFWFRNTKFLYAAMWNIYEFENERVPTFPNLTDMELLFPFGCEAGKYKWVIKVLQHCPKLQNLTIAEVDEEDPDYLDGFLNVESEDLEPLPECLLSQLRTCCLKYLIGRPRDVQFAEYIMMNSKLLSTMTIKSSSWFDENRKQQMQQQMLGILSSCPRGSPTCKLLFD